MPFTVAHAAAVLPLARQRVLPFSALAVGTMTPDLPMFLRVGPSYDSTHDVVTAVPVGIALGLFALGLFQLAKAPAVALLPRTLRRKLAHLTKPHWPQNLAQLLAQCLALAIGVVTHVVWDAFTHEERWGVLLAGLSAPWLTIGSWSVPAYQLLQHLSSLAGMTLLALLAWRWLNRQPSGPDANLTFPRSVSRALRLGLLIAIPLACSVVAWRLRGDYLEGVAYEFLTRTMAAQATLVVLSRVLLKPSKANWCT